jgi:hypothetical protein
MNLAISGVSWDVSTPKDGLPEPALVFRVNRRGYEIVIRDDEISRCEEGDAETHATVLARVREKLEAIKRTGSRKK